MAGYHAFSASTSNLQDKHWDLDQYIFHPSRSESSTFHLFWVESIHYLRTRSNLPIRGKSELVKHRNESHHRDFNWTNRGSWIGCNYLRFAGVHLVHWKSIETHCFLDSVGVLVDCTGGWDKETLAHPTSQWLSDWSNGGLCGLPLDDRKKSRWGEVEHMESLEGRRKMTRKISRRKVI